MQAMVADHFHLILASYSNFQNFHQNFIGKF